MSDDLAVLGIKVESGQVDKAKRSLADLATQGAKTEASINKVGETSKKSSKDISELAGSVKGLVGAYAGFAGARALAGVVDEYTKFNAQLKLATRSQNEFKTAVGDVNRIATTAQASLSSIGTLYARLNNALRDVGVNQAQVGKITETVGLALKVSGATASETSSAMLQLSQAFGSGVLRGEEFNAVNEAAPALMRALAESIGVPIGALRELATSGKLTSDVLAKAFGDDKLLAKFREQAKEVNTISGAFQVFKNSLTNTIGELDKVTGASSVLAKTLKFLSDNIGLVVGVAAGLATLLAAAFAPAVIAGAAALLALFTGPIGIVALLIAATAAAVTYGAESSAAFKKSAEEARKLRNELDTKANGAPIDRDGIAKFRKLEDLEKRQKALMTGDFVVYGKDGATTSRKAAQTMQGQINKLKQELGLINAKTPNGYVPETQYNPFGAPIVKKDGTGGYDARQNNQDEIDKKRLENTKNNQGKISAGEKAETIRRMGLQELEYTTKMRNFEKLLGKIDETDEAQAKAYKEELKRINILQDQANDNYKSAQREFADGEKEKLRELEKTKDGMNQLFREGFASLVNGGTGTWKAFTKQLFTQFKTAVADKIYKLLAEPFIVKIVAGLAGVGVSGVASAAGMDALTGTGSNSLFGSIKDLSSNIQGGLQGSIEKLGSFLASGNGGFGGFGDSVGGFLGQYSAQIANYAPYAGALIQAFSGDLKGAAFTAAGAAIGSFIPGIGTAIGAAVGGLVGSLFGGKKIPQIGSKASGSFSNDIYTGTSGKYGNKDLGAGGTLAGLNEAFSRTLGALFKEFNVNSVISTASDIRSRTNTKGAFYANVEGQQSQAYVRGKAGDVQNQLSILIESALGPVLVQAIQKSKLPEGIKKFFDGLSDKTAVNDAITTIISLKNALIDLPPVFNAVKDAINTTAYSVTIDQLKAQFAATQTFVGLFYSESEKFGIFTGQLSGQLESLNKVLPSSRDEYRAWVDGMTVVDAASRDQFNGLVALAPAMDQYFKLLEAQKEGINEVNQALADGLDRNLYSTSADYYSAQASTVNGVDASRFLARVQNPVMMNEAMANEIKQLRAENAEAKAETKQILQQIASNTAYTAKTNKQWNGDGLPETRVY